MDADSLLLFIFFLLCSAYCASAETAYTAVSRVRLRTMVDKGNKKARQINGLVNEWFLEDMSDSIKSSLTIRRQEGHHIGSFALFGYLKDPNIKGHLIIDEEAAEVVRDVFAMFAQGVGKTNIARILNERGIPNPTEYKRQHGLRYKQPDSKNSTLWKYSAISSMLTNEMYIGNMVQGKYGSVSYKTKINKPRPKSEWFNVEDTHEPIIDRELWDTVQSRIRKRAKPFDTGMIGIFAGKVHCACCGYTMRSSKSRGERYLQCSTRYIHKQACEGAFISVKKLESIVINELNRMSREFLDKDEVAQKIEFAKNLQEQVKKLKADVEKYKKLLSNASHAISECYVDKANGEIDIDEYNLIVKNLRNDKIKYGKIIENDEKRIDELNKRILAGDNRRELIEQYTDIKELDRETVETMIDHIVVGRRIPGTKNYPVEIYWNF